MRQKSSSFSLQFGFRLPFTGGGASVVRLTGHRHGPSPEDVEIQTIEVVTLPADVPEDVEVAETAWTTMSVDSIPDEMMERLSDAVYRKLGART